MGNSFIETSVMGLFDTENPDSIINRTSGLLQKGLLEVPEELMVMEERALRIKVNPTSTLNSLRLKFWYEYSTACEIDTKIDTGRVWRGVCSDFHFYKKVLKSPTMLAWILCPVKSYEDNLQEIMEKCMSKMKDILELPVEKINKDGKTVVDTAAANIILKTYKMMDDRLNGGAVQRIHKIEEVKQEGSMESQPKEILDNRLAELENRLKEKESNGETITISNESEVEPAAEISQTSNTTSYPDA